LGASGKERHAKLTWASQGSRRVWRSDLSEDPIQPLDGEVQIAGWELVTLRVE
jgi:hypothetical protein